MAEYIMDFPTAWAFVRETEMDSHDPRCSYRVANGGLLCDCFILNDEYERRREERRIFLLTSGTNGATIVT